MKIIKRGYVTPEQSEGFRYHAWPTVISLADGTLLAAWSGDRLKHICPYGTVKAARSTDGGYTWGEPYTVLKTPLDNRDAGLCQIGDHIVLTSFATGRPGRVRFLTHWLHGVRTTEERELVERGDAAITDADEARYMGPMLAFSTDNGYTFTEPVHTPITCPHGPTLLKNGEILHVGSLGSTEKGTPGIYALRIDAKCNILSELQCIATKPDAADDAIFCEPYAAEMPNGDILVAIRMQSKSLNTYTIYLSRSTDGGKTFSKPQPTGWHGMPPHIYVTARGEVIMAYGCRECHRMGVYARISRDNGYTWGEELLLRDDCVDWDLGYPTTTENKDGDLVTVYYMKDKKGLHENRIQYVIWNLD